MKISIITVCKNENTRIRETIESILAQTYENVELIVVDGGSDDGTKQYLESMRDKFSFFVSENDNGIYSAQNKGLSKATGDYALFLNGGDSLCDRNVLKKIFGNGQSADLISGNMITVREEKTKECISPESVSVAFLLSNTVWHPVTFIRTDLFRKLGNYDESFKLVADYDFFLRAIMKKASYLHLNYFVSNFYENGASAQQSNIEKIRSEREKSLRKNLGFVPYLFIRFFRGLPLFFRKELKALAANIHRGFI